MPAFRGAIFDVDGVLVDSPHEKAWRESLRQLMESDWSDIRNRTSWSPEAFTSRVYEEQMSGKPRMSGARAALARATEVYSTYYDVKYPAPGAPDLPEGGSAALATPAHRPRAGPVAGSHLPAADRARDRVVRGQALPYADDQVVERSWNRLE